MLHMHTAALPPRDVTGAVHGTVQCLTIEDDPEIPSSITLRTAVRQPLVQKKVTHQVCINVMPEIIETEVAPCFQEGRDEA